MQGVVLGLDVVSEERADKILGPEAAKRYEEASRVKVYPKAEKTAIVLSSQTTIIVRPPSFEPGKE